MIRLAAVEEIAEFSIALYIQIGYFDSHQKERIVQSLYILLIKVFM